MDNNEPGTPVDSTLGYTFQNDFLALTQAFSLPEIDYTDISAFSVQFLPAGETSFLFDRFISMMGGKN